MKVDSRLLHLRFFLKDLLTIVLPIEAERQLTYKRMHSVIVLTKALHSATSGVALARALLQQFKTAANSNAHGPTP